MIKFGLWIFRCFVFLSFVNNSRAQRDPARTPTDQELFQAGLIYASDFKMWPACVNDCGMPAALHSSIEVWCTTTLNRSCTYRAFVRMRKFCSLVGRSPCPADECALRGEPEMLASWVNTVCNLTVEEPGLWSDPQPSSQQWSHGSFILLSSSNSRPSCSDACPGLVASFNSSTLPGFIPILNITKFCPELVDVDGCREACTFANDSRNLFGWVNTVCRDEAYGRETWRDVTMAKEAAWVMSQWIPALFPWSWTVQPLGQLATLATIGIQITDPITSPEPYLFVPPSGPGVCNTSTSEKLGVFAAVNIVSAVFLPILGRRTVVNKLTFGISGNLGSRGWPLMGVLSAALNVVANLVNAYVIRSTPGYENVPIGALALLWCTRPRLAWLAVFLATIEAEKGMYFNCAASAITSEAILQILGAVYFGITADYGRKKRFYLLRHLDPYPRGVDAHVMYAGALLWLVISWLTLIACIVCMLGLGETIENARKMMERVQKVTAANGNVVAGPLGGLRRILNRQQDDTPKAKPRKLTREEIRKIESIFRALIIFMSFLAQWLFWAGFVKAARERYCPPKLGILGAIWSLFSAAGTFVGSAH